MHYYYPGAQGFDGLGIIMMLFWLALLVVLILFAVRLLKHSGDIGGSTNNRRDPLDIVKERYAKGEITKEQFEDLKKDLE